MEKYIPYNKNGIDTTPKKSYPKYSNYRFGSNWYYNRNQCWIRYHTNPITFHHTIYNMVNLDESKVNIFKFEFEFNTKISIKLILYV